MTIYLGPVHGFMGQVMPLLQRMDGLDESRQKVVAQRTRDVLVHTARWEGGLVNWPSVIPASGGSTEHLVQYCRGAPGIVIAACEYPPDPEVDELLLAAGELIWEAEQVHPVDR